jgi:alpha-L-fucosidase
MGPDVRWVGTESGEGRETEWSRCPVDAQSQEDVQQILKAMLPFAPKGDMMGNDLGSRDKILKAKKTRLVSAETDVSIRPGWFYHSEEDSKVKSADELMRVYFSSVGRNGVLLLNIPPNKNGLISDADVKNMQAWKKSMIPHFLLIFLKGSLVRSSNGIILVL